MHSSKRSQRKATNSNRMHGLSKPTESQSQAPAQGNKILQYTRGLENNYQRSCMVTNNLQAQLATTVHELQKLKKSFEKLSRDLSNAQKERDAVNARAQAFETVLSWIYTQDSASPMRCPHSWENLVRENEQNKQRIQELEYALSVQDDKVMNEYCMAMPSANEDTCLECLSPPSLSNAPSSSELSPPLTLSTPSPLLGPYINAP